MSTSTGALGRGASVAEMRAAGRLDAGVHTLKGVPGRVAPLRRTRKAPFRSGQISASA